ncbi:MAG: EAL domain-containing protein [Rhodocyclaceae bacterium]|nr:EAL domain-containing protein [Rhodocyclaceae bacterium]
MRCVRHWSGTSSGCISSRRSISPPGSVVAVEALIRWQSPTMGLVPPDTFIPLAEEVGLIEGIGRWVLEQAGRECELLVAGGYPGIRVAVNLSMRQLRKRDIVAIVRRVLQDNRIAPGQLELEVTETVTMEAPETTIGVLANCAPWACCCRWTTLASAIRRSPG